MVAARTPVHARHLPPGTRVAIVGAGIAGIVAARELTRRGCVVTVFERSPRLAGKCDTFTVRGFEHNLGGHVLSASGAVRALADEVGVGVTPQPFGGAEQIGEFCLYDFERGVVPRTFELLDVLARCRDVVTRHPGLGSPGYVGCADLAAPVASWLRHHGLEAMLSDFRHAYTCAGYGFLDGELSAAYYLKYVAANDFGLSPTCTPKGGFRALLLALAEGLDIRLGQPVLAVDRSAGTLATPDGTYAFDELVVCCLGAERFLDCTPDEVALLSRVRTLPYATVLVDVHGLPDTRLFNLIDGVEPGHVAAFARFNPASDCYNVYGYLAEGQTLDDFVAAVREDFARAGATTGVVHHARRWAYFPHVAPGDLAGGFYERLDALQGRNRTWFLGSLVAFELTGCVVESVQQFVAARMSDASSPTPGTALVPSDAPLQPRFPTVLDAFRHHLARHPDRVLYSALETGTDWTWRDVAAGAAAVAAGLRERGLGAGEPVLLIYPPDSDRFPIGLFGCLLAGVTAVPVAPLPPSPSAGDLERLHRIVDELGCRHALTDATYRAVALASRAFGRVKRFLGRGDLGWPQLTWITTGRPSARDGWRAAWDEAHAEPDTLAYLQYTSGSLGAPKGVAVTHGVLAANVDAIARDAGLDGESRFLGWVPWFHDMGLVAGFFSAAYTGARYLFYSPLTFLRDPASWLRYVDQHRATGIAAPNFGYELAARRCSPEDTAGLDLSCVVHATFGGERTRPATLRRFAERFAPEGFREAAFRNIYGMAESVLYVCGAAEAPTIRTFDAQALDAGRAEPTGGEGVATETGIALASVGTPTAALGVCVRIVDPESRTLRPDGGVGEVWLSSPSVAPGYHRSPAATAGSSVQRGRRDVGAGPPCERPGPPTVHRPSSTGPDRNGRRDVGAGPLRERPGPPTVHRPPSTGFGATLLGEPDGTTFLRTGDLGFVHDGELYLCGRHKEIVIVGGRNLFPEDIEAVAVAAAPGIRPGSVVAFGVEGDDAEEVVVVAEVRRPDQPDLAGAVAAPMVAALSASLGVPHTRVVLVRPRTIPRTSSGKLRRGQVRRDHLAGRLSPLFQTRRARPTTAQENAPESPPEPRSAASIQRWLVTHIAEQQQRDPADIDPDVPLGALGLDSITALVFVQRLSEWLGHTVPLSAIFYHPAISQLARYLEDLGSQQDRPLADRLLVTVNPDLPGEPLYAVHPAGGSVMGYTELSRRLGRPIIAIQAASQLTHTVPGDDASIASLGADYAALLTARGIAPTVLLGYSLGGTLSYEMARYLPSVRRVILIDSAAPGAHTDPAPLSGEALQRHLEITQVGWSIIFTRIRELGRYQYFPSGVREQFVWDGLEFLAHRTSAPEGVRATLLRATALDDDIETAFGHPQYRSLDFGWHRIDPTIEVREVVGADHFTVMVEPHAGAVAGQIEAILRGDSGGRCS